MSERLTVRRESHEREDLLRELEEAARDYFGPDAKFECVNLRVRSDEWGSYVGWADYEALHEPPDRGWVQVQ